MLTGLPARAPTAEQPGPTRPPGGGSPAAGASGGTSGAPSTGGTGGGQPATGGRGRRRGAPGRRRRARPESGRQHRDRHAPIEAGPPPARDNRGIESAAVSGYPAAGPPPQPRRQRSAPAAPFDIRGISWSPAERGGARPTGDSYLRAADRDLPLMRAANINVVKTYVPGQPGAAGQAAGARAWSPSSRVLNVSGDDFEATVAELRDHPALLMWLVGNEWNLNRLYGSCELDACFDRVERGGPADQGAGPQAPGGHLVRAHRRAAQRRRAPPAGGRRRLGPEHLLAARLLQPLRRLAPAGPAHRHPQAAAFSANTAPTPSTTGPAAPTRRPRRRPCAGRPRRSAGQLSARNPALPVPGRHAVRVERRVVEARQPRRPGPGRLRPRRRGRRPLRQRGVVGGGGRRPQAPRRPTRC